MKKYTPLETTQKSDDVLLKARLKALSDRPYSLEHAGMIGGISLINDSASTSMGKVADSLSACEKSVVWIVEAAGKYQEMSEFADLISQKSKAVIAVGDEADGVHDILWKGNNFFVSAQTWGEALDLAIIIGKANDTVLFSPGCPAQEPFESFRERGAYFNRLIEMKSKS
ncbi:MAG: hypothetical protein ABR574_04005 [Cryomorphaceae bacterium]